MQNFHIKIGQTNKLLSTGLFLYLFAIIGIFAPRHHHPEWSDSHSESHHDSNPPLASHSDCQLCLVVAQVYLASNVNLIVSELPLQYELPVSLLAPIQKSRHNPFSSRGPPTTSIFI